MEWNGASLENKGLYSRRWLYSYKTSSTIVDDRPVDMLHDFYIPALQLTVRYDRVAGYFRSSSLAAASQGFSTFIGRQGKMRLIVGADLEPNDVKAILNGDSQRLAARLNDELNQHESLPEDTRNGVELLAWMVANGYLEVRVAFRVHGGTGEPVSFDSIADGYVHEKWFIMHDEFGNRLYGAGTLNESKTALIYNAENIDVHCDWWGEIERLRVDEAAQDFENMWRNRNPHLKVMTLPQAVQKRLIQIADRIDCPVEIDGTPPSQKKVEPPSAMERLYFAVLRDAPKMQGGRFVGIETAPVEPWPHQDIVVRRLVETWPYSYLLCDEVGLGKTIEAGLAFRSLYLSGLAKRIFIAAPASLTRQWQRQMASKLMLSFGRVRTAQQVSHEYILPFTESRAAYSMYEPDLVIMSTGLLARQDRAAALMRAESYDIALVDEAHAARRRNPRGGPGVHPDYGQLYVSIQNYLRKKAHSLWLATATPMQINPVEVCDLLALTNRVGAFQFDPSLTMQYYEVLGKLVQRENPRNYEWNFLQRAVKSIKMQDPLLWEFIDDSVIDGRIRAAVYQWLNYGRAPRGKDRDLMCRLIFSASPLSRVMMRHTRQLLEIYRDNGQLQQNLAQRHILPMPRIVFTPLEERIYNKLEEYCQGLTNQIRAENHQARQMVSFLLSFLRLRFASSLYAIRNTLRRRLRKVEATLKHQLHFEAEESGAVSLHDLVFEDEEEDDLVAVESLLKNRTIADLEWERNQLKNLLKDMADISGPSSKMKHLTKILEQRRDKQTRRIHQTVVFTRFYDTLRDIAARLHQVDPQMLIGTYSGQGAEYFDSNQGKMLSINREEVKERFLRGEIDILVCTDAAAEGLNLQTADMLVNFDLGWNPMKVEQRIGRVDRIGQRHRNIYVVNFCYAGSAEEIVYGRLLDRLSKANMIVGTQQISLLPVEAEEFQQLTEGELTPEELEARAQERIQIQRKHRERMEVPSKDLYDTYMRLARSGKRRPAPVDLSSIWEAFSGSRYLQDLGCITSTINGKSIQTLSGLDNIPDGAILTASRELYEEGLDDEVTRVHFATYGDPYFDAILQQLGEFELPPCVQKITVPIPGLDGMEMVGYAVACRGASNYREVKLVSKWSDLKNLHLAEDESLAEEDIAPLRKKLQQMGREEFQHYLAADRIERENLRAAQAHEKLNLHVIRGLFEAKAISFGKDALFTTVLREVESLFEDREHIRVNDLPADDFRNLTTELLFECKVPQMGDKGTIQVPRILAQTSIDAVNRLVDSMKVKKSELTVDAILKRLQREIQENRRVSM